MQTFKRIIICANVVAAGLFASTTAQAAATFDAVKAKGFVQCGVSVGHPGFSLADNKGQWRGLNLDLCRAIAAALFNDANQYRLTALSDQQRFTALQSGEIDVLTMNSTQTLARDTTLGVIGAGVNYYDSQGIMAAKSMGVASAQELDGATVCVRPGTTSELNLADWFRAHGIQFTPVVIERADEGVRAFAAGRCDAYTTDKLLLAATRITMLENPDDYVILPEDFSKEPLGPMVRQGDEQWFNVVRWTLNAMLEAEEYGITSKNVDEMLKSSNPNVQRILGVTPGMGSAMKLERGINAQWRDGGLMYGWPIC